MSSIYCEVAEAVSKAKRLEDMAIELCQAVEWLLISSDANRPAAERTAPDARSVDQAKLAVDKAKSMGLI